MSWLKKLKCYFGFHNHVVVIDQAMTDFMHKVWPFDGANISACTTLKCIHCGHTYESRTMSVEFRSTEK